MAKLSDLIVKLSLDSSKFTKGLTASTQSLTKIQKKFTDTKTGMVDFNKVTTGLSNTAASLSTKLKFQEASLDALKKKHAEVAEAQGEDSAEALKLSNAIGRLELSIADTKAQLNAINNSINQNSAKFYQLGVNMQGIGDRMRETGAVISEVGASLTSHVTVPLLSVGTAAVKTTAEFDSAMSEVAAISGATGDEFNALREKAIEMGAKTKFSASESAEAMKYMAMAGWDSQQMLEGLAGVMNAAAASGDDLGAVSDILTDGLTAFGMAASESGRMADVLTAAATSSNTTIGLLGETFRYTASVCGALGINLEDCAVATGLMANAGIKGSQAGTALRAGLVNLIQPSSTVAAAMDKYGIALQTNADGSANLSETMQLLRDRMGGLSETERAAALAALFGKEAVSGWSAIVSASEGDFNNLTSAIANSGGAAEKIANLKLDNLSGQFTILKSTLEGVAIQIGDILTPTVSGIVAKIQEFATAFSNLDEGTKQTIVSVAAVVAAVGPVTAVIGTAVSAIGGAVSAIGSVVAAVGAGTGVLAALGGAFTALAGPIAVVVAVVAAVAIAVVTHFDQIKAGVQGAFAAIANVCSGIASTVSGVLSTIGNIIQVGLMTIGSMFSAAVTIITLPWQMAWQNVKGVVLPILNSVKAAISTAFNAIRNTISGIMNTVKGTISSVWNGIRGVITNVVGGIRSAVSSGFNAVKTAVSGPVNAAKSAVTSAFNSIKSTISNTISNAKSIVSSGLNAIKGFFSSLHLSFPKIKLPHFSITGSFSLNPPSVPHLSVAWYKQGAIFAKPTIFDTPYGLKGVGEAGPEAVAPIGELLGMIRQAVGDQAERTNELLQVLIDLIRAWIKDHPPGTPIVLDSGELVGILNARLGTISGRNERWN